MLGLLAGLYGGEVAIVGAGTQMGVSHIIAMAVSHQRTLLADHIHMISGCIVVPFGDCNVSYLHAVGIVGESMLAMYRQMVEEPGYSLSGLHSPAVAVVRGLAVA